MRFFKNLKGMYMDRSEFVYINKDSLSDFKSFDIIFRNCWKKLERVSIRNAKLCGWDDLDEEYQGKIIPQNASIKFRS